MVQKLALLWIMLLSFMGSQKAKSVRLDPTRSGQTKARDIALDEYEILSYHTN